MWFAFIFVFLLYEEQQKFWILERCKSCDLLSFLYFCSMRNNLRLSAKTEECVVICFHFCIFALWGTTICWFFHARCSCDLLSFLYFCSMRNNLFGVTIRQDTVVICFHFCIFALWGTTEFWKSVSLFSCDLLSFLYFCSMRNNDSAKFWWTSIVVICFHFCIFALWGTTRIRSRDAYGCCDLLSFLYFCSMRNNDDGVLNFAAVLWFAFIFVFLLYEEQLTTGSWTSLLCCDLLSFLYFCSMRNNAKKVGSRIL